MADTSPNSTSVPAVKPHWYHGHSFHLGAGVFMSWLYAVAVLVGVPVMSALKLGVEDEKDVLIAWGFMSFFYFWRKGKRITAHIDRKNVLTGRVAKWEIFLLLLPYAAFILDVFLKLLLRDSLHYDGFQWAILWGTVMVTTFVLDVNSSFLTDLLKAAPVQERVEHEER